MSQLTALQLDRKLCVSIVDDHEAIRLGFKGACTEHKLDLCASVSTVSELFERGAQNCDVVVLDLSLADGSIVEDNVQRIIKAGPQVVIYSIADKQSLIRAALRAGAATLVPKASSMQELVEAIRLVADGVYVNTIQATAAIDGDHDFKAANLSPREREVLSLYASGLPLKQVANALEIKLSTAKEHIDRVRTKYSTVGRVASTKTDLLLRAIEDGIIDEGSL